MGRGKIRRLIAKVKQQQRRPDPKSNVDSSVVPPVQNEYAARLAGMRPDPVFLNETVLREQFVALIRKTTEELECLAQQGGSPFSLKLVLWMINRRKNPPKPLPVVKVAAKAAKKRKRTPTPPVLREGVAPKVKSSKPAGSSPVGPPGAGGDWWRESGE